MPPSSTMSGHADKLRDKVVVITGGSRGLGRAIAEQAAARGAIVVLAARSAAELDACAAAIRAAGGRASTCPTDVTSLDAMQALRDHALREHGRLDAWVNDAGTAGAFGPIIEQDPEAFLRVVDTIVRGAYFGSLLAIRHFREHGGGTLLNMLGRGDTTPVPMQCAYGSSKTWLRAFTLALAAEQKDRPDIAVFALNPGMVATAMLHEVEVIAGHEQGLAVFPTATAKWARPSACGRGRPRGRPSASSRCSSVGPRPSARSSTSCSGGARRRCGRLAMGCCGCFVASSRRRSGCTYGRPGRASDQPRTKRTAALGGGWVSGTQWGSSGVFGRSGTIVMPASASMRARVSSASVPSAIAM